MIYIVEDDREIRELETWKVESKVHSVFGTAPRGKSGYRS